VLAAAAVLPLTLVTLSPAATADHKSKPVPRSCVPPVALTVTQAYDLSFTRDEERMALDLYTLFAEVYENELPGHGRAGSRDGTGIFSNIDDSELTHTTTVLAKLETYCLPDPAWHMDDGEYVVPAIQELYDEWEAQGLTSLDEALQVGIELEERDIDDLEALIAKENPADIEAVYVNLCEGSLSHWAAFSDVAGAPAPDVEGRCLPDD
jgi:hypothetical protein